MAAPHIFPDPSSDKKTLRATMRARRRAHVPHPESILALSTGLGAALRMARARGGDGPVAGVWPLPGEPDLTDALAAWHEAGHEVCLPRTHAPGTALTFHAWTPGLDLHEGPFGTRHPPGEAVVPRVVLVPLLAFDRRGGRLGYGGGYYDRTLASLPDARTIGFGFAFQEVTEVPMGPYDRSLDMIVTEAEMIRIGF